jgi:hypothetical protein
MAQSRRHNSAPVQIRSDIDSDDDLSTAFEAAKMSLKNGEPWDALPRAETIEKAVEQYGPVSASKLATILPYTRSAIQSVLVDVRFNGHNWYYIPNKGWEHISATPATPPLSNGISPGDGDPFSELFPAPTNNVMSLIEVYNTPHRVYFSFERVPENERNALQQVPRQNCIPFICEALDKGSPNHYQVWYLRIVFDGPNVLAHVDNYESRPQCTALIEQLQSKARGSLIQPKDVKAIDKCFMFTGVPITHPIVRGLDLKHNDLSFQVAVLCNKIGEIEEVVTI